MAERPDPYEPWAKVLAKFVDQRGAVDFHALARNRGELVSFMGYVARTSPRSAPELFPGREEKIAYYLNAYNAISMFNVIDSGFPQSLGVLRRVRFFAGKRFPVGGERMSLYALENDIIRPLGDERVHLALNCMSVSCPRLPREPFRAATLNKVLDEEARKFFAEPRNVDVVPRQKVARVSSILKFYKEDFLAKSPSLIAYINRYRERTIPEDFKIEFIEYDWTVNDQHREQSANESG